MQWKRWRKSSWYFVMACLERRRESGQLTSYSKVNASRPGVREAGCGGGGAALAVFDALMMRRSWFVRL